MTTFAFVAEGFDGSWQKIPHAGFQMKSTSNVEEPIFFYTKMVDFTKGDDAEIAAIMGHEVAHAVARHGMERMSQEKLAGTALGLGALAVAVSTQSAETARASANLAGKLMNVGILLPYSRLHESEADHIGVILAAKAGYDPRAAVRVWEKMAALAKGKEPFFFLSTHPVNEDRIKDLRKVMDEAMTYYEKSKRKK
jgi:predicted Zn-dependent protease